MKKVERNAVVLGGVEFHASKKRARSGAPPGSHFSNARSGPRLASKERTRTWGTRHPAPPGYFGQCQKTNPRYTSPLSGPPAVKFCLDFSVRYSDKPSHEIFELAEITRGILRGSLGVICHAFSLMERMPWCAGNIR
jgi:hypothetical protein